MAMSSNFFSIATKHHRAGQFEQAKENYLHYLNNQPNNFDALLLLGNVFLELKDYPEAKKFLKKAESIDGNNFSLQMNLAVTYQYLKEFDQANLYISNLAKKYSNDANVFNNQGNIFKDQCNYEQSEIAYKKALQIDPRNEIFIFNYCFTLYFLEKYDEALNYLIKIKSTQLFNKPQILLMKIYNKLSQYSKLIYIGEKIIDNVFDFERPEVAELLIYAYLKTNQINLAESLLSSLKASSIEKSILTAAMLQQKGQILDAIAIYKKLLALNSKSCVIYQNLGDLYLNQLDYPNAETYFKKALEINPNFIESKISLGISQLSNNLYKQGFANFTAYQSKPHVKKRYPPNGQLWTGDNNQSRVCIYLDQGVGDQIFFASLINRLDNFKNEFTIVCDKRLVELFKRSFLKKYNFLALEELDKNNNSFDFYCHGYQLGQIFIKTLRDLTLQKKFLFSASTLKPLSQNSFVGISWKSSNIECGFRKSIDLEKFIKKIKVHYSHVISLQYGDDGKILQDICNANEVNLIQHQVDTFDDIDGLAELISQCKAVITISNVTAHLAGALGIQSNLILPWQHQSKFWYWSARINQKSLWYPSVTIMQARKENGIEEALNYL